MAAALHRACTEDNLLLVSIILDRTGVAVNVKDKQGRTALHLAAINNNQLLAEMLFQYGADTRALSNRGSMPLDCASEEKMTLLLAKMMARDGGYELIKERLKLMNKPEKLKQKIAREVEKVPHEKRTLPLLASLVNIPRNTVTNFYGMRESDSPRSSLSNISDCSKRSFADSGYSDFDRTAWLSQSKYNSTESFQTYSELGSERRVQIERRITTALTTQELAALRGSGAITSSYTAPKKPKEIVTPCTKLRRKTHPSRTASILVNQKPITGRRKHVSFPSDVLLDVAVANDDFVDACHLIKSRKVDFNRRGPNGLTPMHRAAIEGSYECLQLLVDQGANVNVCNDQGWTPLHDAVFHGNISCVLALLKAGTNVSAQTNDFLGLLELAGDKTMLLIVGRALILHDLGFVSDIEDDVANIYTDSERESCV